MAELQGKRKRPVLSNQGPDLCPYFRQLFRFDSTFPRAFRLASGLIFTLFVLPRPPTKIKGRPSNVEGLDVTLTHVYPAGSSPIAARDFISGFFSITSHFSPFTVPFPFATLREISSATRLARPNPFQSSACAPSLPERESLSLTILRNDQTPVETDHRSVS